MVAVAHGHHTHPVLPGLLDRYLHRPFARDVAQGIIAVEDPDRATLTQQSQRRGAIELASHEATDVSGKQIDAMRMSATQVRLDEGIGYRFGMFIRNPRGGKYPTAE